MDRQFKCDVLKYFFQYSVLCYFMIGYLKTYAWTCRELDYVSNYTEIMKFWNPIALTDGVLNIIVFVLVLICWNITTTRSESRQSKSQVIFYIFMIPSFTTSIIYVIIKAILLLKSPEMGKGPLMLLLISEMSLFCGCIILLNLVSEDYTVSNNFQKQFLNFVISLKIFGMVDYLIFYSTRQQVDNFINVASKFPVYSKFYNISILGRNHDLYNLTEFNTYLQPIVILFCCLSAIYLTIYLNSDNKEITGPSINTEQEGTVSNSAQSVDTTAIITKHDFLRLLPVSLLLGLFLITIILLIIIVVNPLIYSKAFKSDGELISAFLPIPIYLVSIALMYCQVKEIYRWPLLQQKTFDINKVMVWIGTSGQTIQGIGQLALCTYKDDSLVSRAIVFEYLILIIQVMMQSITICLALDRQSVPPADNSWTKYICPSVGMLAINLGFLVLSTFYAFVNDYTQISQVLLESKLFIRIFTNGFQSLGLTLGILYRLHSSIIFGKIVLSARI